jgi:hypothetical protein
MLTKDGGSRKALLSFEKYRRRFDPDGIISRKVGGFRRM